VTAKIRDPVGASEVAIELLAQLFLDISRTRFPRSKPDLFDHPGV
jgi:hypothetical protein